jgi:hypothetical protein
MDYYFEKILNFSPATFVGFLVFFIIVIDRLYKGFTNKNNFSNYVLICLNLMILLLYAFQDSLQFIFILHVTKFFYCFINKKFEIFFFDFHVLMFGFYFRIFQYPKELLIDNWMFFFDLSNTSMFLATKKTGQRYRLFLLLFLKISIIFVRVFYFNYWVYTTLWINVFNKFFFSILALSQIALLSKIFQM